MKRFKKYTSEDKSLERALASDAQKPKKPVTLKKAPWEKNEANDAYCSDECCGSDVKAEDCPCPADCDHCSCNAVNEGLEEGKMKDFHDMVNKGMSAAQIAKKIKMPVKDVADFMKGMKEDMKPNSDIDSHPAVKDARKQHKDGVWDGNVDRNGNAIVHIKGKPHTVTNTNTAESVGMDEAKKVSDMTPEEKAANDKRRKEYNEYQKSKRNESAEEVTDVLNDYITDLEEGGLWANIHAKRKRIKNGSKEKMKKPGSKGAPTDQDFKDASESVEEAFSDWKIQHPTKSTKSYTVKARNTGEALKKGHAAAIKAGDMHKASDPRSIQSKHVSKNESTVDEGSCGSVNASKKKVSGSDKKKLLNVAGLKKNANDKNLQANYESFKESLDEAAIDDITALYINENNITLDQLEDMTEEELNEIIGKAIGGAFKLGAKAVVGTARLAKKAVGGTAKIAKKTVVNKQGNIRGTAAAKDDKAGDKAEKMAKQREADYKRKKRISDMKKRATDIDKKISALGSAQNGTA